MMRLLLVDAVARDSIPACVRVPAHTPTALQSARSLAPNTACVVLYGVDDVGATVAMCVPQVVGVYVRVPHNLLRCEVERLWQGVRNAVGSELVHRTPIMGYTCHRDGEDRSLPSRLPFARVCFASSAHALQFARIHKGKGRAGKRVRHDLWVAMLKKARIYEPALQLLLDDDEHFSVHHVEDPLDAFFDAVNASCGLRTLETVATYGAWFTFCQSRVRDVLERGERFARRDRNFALSKWTLRPIDPAACGVTACLRDDARGCVPRTLSYDLETYSPSPAFPKVGDPLCPIIHCGIATTTDASATVQLKVLCLQTHTRRAHTPQDAADTAISCASDIKIVNCATEQALIEAFGEHLRRFCPDVLTGFNTVKFDNIVLMIRAVLFRECHARSFERASALVRHAKRAVAIVRAERVKLDAGESSLNVFLDTVTRLSDFEKVIRQSSNDTELPEQQLERPEFVARAAVQWDLPTVLTTLARLEVDFTREVYDYYASGPDVPWFFWSGRLVAEPVELHTKVSDTGADGQLVIDHWGDAFGVTNDMWHWAKRSVKLDNFRLNDVAAFALGDAADAQKHDMDHKDVRKAWAEEDTAFLRKVALYCAQDALLPIRLAFSPALDSVQMIWGFAELQRATPAEVTLGGQSRKAMRQALQSCGMFGYVPNDVERPAPISIKGATVQPPVFGLHDDPVATVDFASLYPTINIHHNFSWETRMSDGQAVPDGIVVECTDLEGMADAGDARQRIVVNFRGLLPGLQLKLLSLRGEYKKRMGQMTCPKMRASLNRKQLVVKTCANGLYGITAAQTGYLRDQRIGALTTQKGRTMIEQVRRCAVGEPGSGGEMCTDDPAGWRRFKRQVVYGDTDSIFIKFDGATVAQAFEAACQMCAHIDRYMFPPRTGVLDAGASRVSLLAEGVYDGMFIDAMKKYCGVAVSDPRKADTCARKLTFKGLSAVRRDAPAYIREATQRIFAAMLPVGAHDSRRVEATHAAVRKVMCEVLNSLVDETVQLAKCADSKTLKTTYAKPDAIVQACVARRHNELVSKGTIVADPITCGDRVSYVRTLLGGRESSMCASAASVSTVDALRARREDMERSGTKVPNAMYARSELDVEYCIERLRKACGSFLKAHVPLYATYFDKAKACVGQRRAKVATDRMFGMRVKSNGVRESSGLAVTPLEARWSALDVKDDAELANRLQRKVDNVLQSGEASSPQLQPDEASGGASPQLQPQPQSQPQSQPHVGLCSCGDGMWQAQPQSQS